MDATNTVERFNEKIPFIRPGKLSVVKEDKMSSRLTSVKSIRHNTIMGLDLQRVRSPSLGLNCKYRGKSMQEKILSKRKKAVTTIAPATNEEVYQTRNSQ